MNIDDSGTVDECERLLRTPLKNRDALSINDRKHLKHALDWYRGDRTDPLGLVGWMAVSRIVGEHIAVRLDTGNQYHYLRFDSERNRVVLIDPHDSAEVPVEETDVRSIFDTAAISLVPSREIKVKTYDAVTAVTNDDHGTKIVLGDFDSAVTQHTDEGETIEYHPKTTFTLPDPMTPDEIEDWLSDEDSAPVRTVVMTNHEREWDTTDSNSNTP